MQTTKGQTMIRCPYCGQVKTMAEARACGRRDAALEPEQTPDEPAHRATHRFEVWG